MTDLSAGRKPKLSMRATLICSLVVIVAVSCAWWLKSPDNVSKIAFDPAVQVPAQANQIAWADSLHNIASGLATLANKVRGSEGLQEATRLLLAVRSLDDEGLSEIGLVADQGVAGFSWRDGNWIVLPVSSEVGASHLVELLGRRGHQVTELPARDSLRTWRIHTRAKDRVLGHLWLVDQLVIARTKSAPLPTDATPIAAAPEEVDEWLTSKRMKPGALVSKGELNVRWNFTKRDPLLSKLRRALGPAALLFGRYVASFKSAQASLSLRAPGPALNVRLYAPKEQASEVRRYHFGFIENDAALLNLADVLPDEVIAIVRSRIHPNLVSMAAGLLKMAGGVNLGIIDPSLRSLDADALLLEPFDGQLAVALLGVSDEATPDIRQWRGGGWRRQAGVAIAMAMTTDTAANLLVERVRQRLSEDGAGFKTTTLGNWTGLTRKGGQSSWSLVRHKRGVLWILGDGELQRFERVTSGRFPSLGKVVQGALERSVVDGKGQWISALLTTGRAVRSARRRGIPNSITAMVASVAALAAGIELHDDGVSVRLTLRPAKIDNTKKAEK